DAGLRRPRHLVGLCLRHGLSQGRCAWQNGGVTGHLVAVGLSRRAPADRAMLLARSRFFRRPMTMSHSIAPPIGAEPFRIGAVLGKSVRVFLARFVVFVAIALIFLLPGV